MVFTGNILAALLTFFIRDLFRRIIGYPRGAVDNNSSNLFEILGLPAIIISSIYSYYVLRRTVEPRTSESQTLEQQTLEPRNLDDERSKYNNPPNKFIKETSPDTSPLAGRVAKAEAWVNNNFCSSKGQQARRCISDTFLEFTQNVSRFVPKRSNNERERTNVESHRSERHNLETEEPQPSTSGIPNLKRRFSFKENIVPPSKLFATDYHEKPLKFKDSEGNDPLAGRVAKAERSERHNLETEESQPSTSGISNLKRPFSFKEKIVPPSKLFATDYHEKPLRLKESEGNDASSDSSRSHLFSPDFQPRKKDLHWDLRTRNCLLNNNNNNENARSKRGRGRPPTNNNNNNNKNAPVKRGRGRPPKKKRKKGKHK